jgi:hypothetical protein
VPAQQGSGRHQPQSAQMWGQQPAQRAEERAVDPGEGRAGVVASKHRDLVAQHEDLGLFGDGRSGEQSQPAQHAAERQVHESKRHDQRSCWTARDP